MIELNETFFIQLINFFIMIFFLNHFLFKPIMEIVERRNNKLKTLIADTKKFTNRADDVAREYADKLADMKKETNSILAEARKSALDEQGRIIGDARSQFAKEVEAAKSEIDKEAKEVSIRLKRDTEELGQDIAGKILGRSA